MTTSYPALSARHIRPRHTHPRFGNPKSGRLLIAVWVIVMACLSIALVLL
ncbi:hypothetical protein [Nocardia brasiliensis]